MWLKIKFNIQNPSILGGFFIAYILITFNNKRNYLFCNLNYITTVSIHQKNKRTQVKQIYCESNKEIVNTEVNNKLLIKIDKQEKNNLAA